ncbi:NlpC/P60 family protein [Streptomyces fractus]|uniref:NlpC/P60 family protein n=1 Tax=Streptomyces fractus TaxID=641806 RepID=UPI003CEA9759
MPGVIVVQDDDIKHVAAPRVLSTQLVAGTPQRLQVSDSAGLLATLTVGAKTVTVRGQTRTFTEQKRPFVDDFDRTTSGGWGASPGGGTWSNSGGSDAEYSVANGVGLINMTAANSSRHTSLINDVTDVDARLSWSLDVMPVGNASSLALSFAYASSSNQYRARLSVLTTGTVQLTLECESGGTTTTLGALTTVGTGYAVGDVWHIRAQRQGTTLRCRAWKDGTTEPTTWVHEVTDATLGAGRVGVRGLASSGSTATPFNFRVHDIQVYSGTWPSPPVVTHNTWVRVLPTAFDGTWTSALDDRVQRWAVDTTPDVLACAMMYVTGAPPVSSPALGGARIAGQSLYGPNDVDGTRIEGGDFHDFMGRDWTFANGETEAAKASEYGCMDCSGFVRMVYGFHMGIPLVRTSSFNGLNLPRMTKDIGPSGPGVVVAQSTGSAPPLTAMQIGDVPLFDADTGDAVAGQMDHNGIYLGVDNAGVPRFVNSRKTPNGPTFGDLGGASTLTGTGLYATSLRIVRRF